MSAQDRVPVHKHCSVCGRSMPVNRDFCSPECRGKSEKSHKKSKRISKVYTLAMIAVFAGLMIFTFISSRVP